MQIDLKSYEISDIFKFQIFLETPTSRVDLMRHQRGWSIFSKAARLDTRGQVYNGKFLMFWRSEDTLNIF